MTVFWAAIIGAVIIYAVVKRNNNLKDAQNGADKSRVRMVGDALFGEGGNNRTMYAHWETRESYGRTVKITYYRYVVTYRENSICVAPIYVDKNTRQIQVGKPIIYTPENLGKISVKVKQKNGAPKRIELWLGNKKGQTLLQLRIDSENLRSNRYFPFNIVQQDECAAFENFVTPLAQRIDAENPGVDDMIKAYNNSNLGFIGVIVSVIGAVASFPAPSSGAFVALIGLVLAVVSKVKGSTNKWHLPVSIACMVLSVVFFVMYLKTSFFQ